MREEENPSGWHLKKEIQLGHIITTLTVAVSAMWYVNKIELRVAVLESDRTTQSERDDRQDKAATEAAAAIGHRFDIIDAKLDRLIERQMASRK